VISIIAGKNHFYGYYNWSTFRESEGTIIGYFLKVCCGKVLVCPINLYRNCLF